MDLMRLGIQSRKTGIKPKENLAKDKHDMEDIDEFFNESSWAVSADDKNNEKQDFNFKKKRSLGLGRQRLSNIKDITRLLPMTSSISSPETQETSNGAKLLGIEAPLSPRQEESGLENMNSYLDLDLLEVDNTTSGIPKSYLPPVESKSERPNPKTESPHLYQKLSFDQKTKKYYSRLTKNMALKRSSQNSESEIYLDDQSANFSSSSDEVIPTSPVGESQASNTENFQNSRSYGLSQTFRNLSGSLPSPPPEGLRRSKRTKIAPLAYWRNERIVYSRAQENSKNPDSTLISDIRKVPLQEILKVIHVPEKPKKDLKIKGRQKVKARTRSRVAAENTNAKEDIFDYESDPEIRGSEWFQQKSLEAEIFDDNEDLTSRIVAWAPNGGEFQLPIINEDGLLAPENFQVASLFDMDLDSLAAGLLDFPTEGFKSLRSAGGSIFIFHVARGLIEVTLNGKKFVVTRGCSFEIPKYNVYSFKNLGHGSARLFFVQCQISSQ